MLYIITLAVYSYLFWRMSHLPYQAYIKALVAFDYIERERYSYFRSNRRNNQELDARSSIILDKIKDPGIFIVKEMFAPFCYCVLFSIFCLWVFFWLDLITLDGVRIFGSSIFVACLFILAAHLGLIDRYKKQARKMYEEKCREEERQEQAELQDLLQRTSADYDNFET